MKTIVQKSKLLLLYIMEYKTVINQYQDQNYHLMYFQIFDPHPLKSCWRSF